MNTSFADWYRSVSIVPTNEMLRLRWEGIITLTKKANVDLVMDLVLFYYGKQVSDERLKNVTSIFQDKDATFSLKNNSAELKVLAGASLLELLEKKNELSTLTALLVVCYSFGRLGEGILPELVGACDNYLLNKDNDERIKNLTAVKLNTSKKLTDELTKHNTAPTFESLKVPLQQIGTDLEQQKSAIRALELKLAQRYEESQVLWWLFGEFSSEMQCHFLELNNSAWVFIAKELADKTESQSGLASAKAFLYKALKISNKHTAKTSFSQSIPLVDEQWLKGLNANIEDARLKPFIPTLVALSFYSNPATRETWLPNLESTTLGFNPASEFPLVEMALQSYRERLLFRELLKLKSTTQDR